MDIDHDKQAASRQSELGRDASAARGLSRMVRRLRDRVHSTLLESTQALVAAVDARDSYTQAHSQSVAAYAEAIGRRAGMSTKSLATLRSAALLHDVGKIGVPDSILTKAGPLTAEEFETVKHHPRTGFEILEHMSSFADERMIILHHHERFDGAGYPAGLAGEAIPIGARIVAVADAVDTMLSPRTYKKSFTIEHVCSELRECAGQQFDPKVVAVTLKWIGDRWNPVTNSLSDKP